MFRKNIWGMLFNIEILVLFFDCFIGGIVNYCLEIWGNNIGCNIEKFYIDFCK